jgi:hypothetical protein
MPEVTINCLLQKNPYALTVSLAPFRAEVRYRGSVTLVWEAQGAGTFPESNFFAWKVGGPGRLPDRSADGKTLTLTYDVPAESTWSYMITLKTGDGATVVIDPDIHNDPPPTM